MKTLGKTWGNGAVNDWCAHYYTCLSSKWFVLFVTGKKLNTISEIDFLKDTLGCNYFINKKI